MIGSTLIMLLALTPGLSGQTGGAGASGPEAGPVPFGPGERMEYQVRVGLFGNVGSGFLDVDGTEMVRGSRAYHLRFGLDASVLFGRFRVDNLLQSWMDVSTLTALRFQQDQNEPNFERHRTFDFYPAEGIWRLQGSDETGPLATDEPLDDVSFLFYVRALPLEVGETYTMHRYYKDDGNPVTVRVLRKERVTVPAGTFNTVVVQPIIQTDGLFGEGGEAEVYFSDDDRRVLVMLKSRVPVLRSLDFELTSYTPGARLSPFGF